MIGIATKLGATRRENLSEFVPNYVPPPPKLSFFSRPPVTKQVIDRQTEREALLSYLDDDKVTVISLGGPSGIGKTYIAAWLVSEAVHRHYGCIWVDCIDREVTQESFLAAVAYKIQDKYLAAFVCDPGQKITDRFDVVIDYLDQNTCLLIFNDYHCIPVEKGLDNFFTRVVQKAVSIKILITTRVRPTCVDNPNWAPGSAVEMILEGVPVDFIPSFAKVAELSSEQITGIWERTSGNPYAIGLFMSLLRNRHGNVQIETLPLFNDAKAKSWSNSLIEILPADVRTFASRMAVVRSTLNTDLIEKLSYTSRDKAIALIDQALNTYVLHEVCPGEYQMQEYIREALLSKAGEKEIRKAHGAAGSYFEKLASNCVDPFVRAEVILECLYHYDNAGNWEGILAHVTTVYETLISRGDHDRSYTVSRLAVRAAKAVNDKPQTTRWLIAEIKRELDLKRLDDANKNIIEAFRNVSMI